MGHIFFRLNGDMVPSPPPYGRVPRQGNEGRSMVPSPPPLRGTWFPRPPPLRGDSDRQHIYTIIILVCSIPSTV